MKINRIKLRGFIGIKKGMGLDEVDLDLSGIGGLIAFDGPNGVGKSTILDNMHGYACLASRTGALSHHVFLRNSSRELDFLWQGKLYKTIVKIDAESSRSEGFIYLGESRTSEVNGKISEYKEYIEKLFGSQNLFFNSVFCAQNADKINDMTTAQLKSLFSEFLRLDKLIEYENTSKQCANILGGRLAQVERNIEDVQKELAKHDGVNTKIAFAKSKIADIEDEREDAKQTLESDKKDMQRIKEFSAGIEAHKQRLGDLTTRHKGMTADLEKDREASEQALSALRNRSMKLRAELKGHRQIMDRADNVRRAAKDLEELTRKLDALEDDRPRLRKAYDDAGKKLQEISYEIKRLVDQQKALAHDSELSSLSMRIDIAEEQEKALDLKDPACKSTTCSFIVAALKAAKELPGLVAKHEARKAELAERNRALAAEIDKLKKADILARTREQDSRIAYDFLNDSIRETKQDIQAIEQNAKLISALEVAEKLSDDIEKRIHEVDSEGIAIRDAFVTREADKIEDIKSLESVMDELKKQLKNDPEKDIEELENKISFIENNIAGLDKYQAEKRAELARLESDLVAMGEAQRRLEDLRAERQGVTKEISEWRYLQQACGKDGIRALEIDSVAPVMSGYANRLLHGAFGPHYSIKMITQDDQGREILDIIALRGDGSQTLIDNLSGGERVWSLKALRLAMMMMSIEKSGRAFGSMFCDEEDGSLSNDNAIRFVGLYRQLMKATGVEDCFYITHRPDCVALADHVVSFNGGGVTIN